MGELRLSPTQIIVLGFVLIILLGGILLSLPVSSASNEATSFVDAVFTATSAVCVTGLAVVDTGTYWSIFGKIIVLILIQIGGLGFMSVATFYTWIIGKKITFKQRLLIQESYNQNDLSGLIKLALYVLVATFVIEGVGALLLSIQFVPEYGLVKGLWYSVFHSVSAFCNAGFDIVGNGRSLTPYADSFVVNITIIGLIILGGIGFSVMMDITKKRAFSKFSLHSKIVISTTVMLLVISFILFFIFEFNNLSTMGNMSFGEKILASMFQAVTPRTAGFNTIDISSLTTQSKFLTTILMFIGGSPGSTAGGVKTVTLAVIFLLALSTIQGKKEIVVFERKIKQEFIAKATVVLVLALLMLGIIVLGLVVVEPGISAGLLSFEAISAFATVGLSMGITSRLGVLAKVIISLAMFAGRVGILTILLSLPSKNNDLNIKYPVEKISVG